MKNVAIKLDHLHCNKEADHKGAEPYMWTLFFYLDINSLFLIGKRVVTVTPGSNFTTRGMYPDDVHAGDNVPIPSQLGNFDITLEHAGLQQEFAGFMCVLMDQDETDADAIRAGHQAFGEVTNRVLNAFIETKLDAVDKSPTATEIEKIKDEIKAGVSQAVKEAQNLLDLIFDDQDRFVGFGYKFFDHEELEEIASSTRKELTVSIQRKVSGEVKEDYDVIGRIDVGRRPSDRFFDRPALEPQIFAIKKAKGEIDKLRGKLKGCDGSKREDLKSQIRDLQNGPYKAAKKELRSKLVSYNPQRKSCGCDGVE